MTQKILRWQNKKDGIVQSDFSPTLRAGGSGIRKHPLIITDEKDNNEGGGNQVIVSLRGRNIVGGKRKDYKGAPTIQRLEMNNNDQANCLTGVEKDNLVLVKSATKDGFEIASEGDSINFSIPNSATRRGRVGNQQANTLDTQSNQAVLLQGNIRRLTEIECERLQGFPDGWTKYGVYEKQVWINKKEGTFEIVQGVKEIPRTQRYKLCGNAVTKTVVELIGIKLLEE